MMRMVIISLAVILFYSPEIFACPSGQSCPAGKDCVADSSLCVADSSSTSGSSTEPTTTKDQLGLTFTPVTGPSGLVYYTFVDRASAETEGTAPSESPYAVWSTYNFSSSDAQNASAPPLEGGIWGLPSDVTVH